MKYLAGAILLLCAAICIHAYIGADRRDDEEVALVAIWVFGVAGVVMIVAAVIQEIVGAATKKVENKP